MVSRNDVVLTVAALTKIWAILNSIIIGVPGLNMTSTSRHLNILITDLKAELEAERGKVDIEGEVLPPAVIMPFINSDSSGSIFNNGSNSESLLPHPAYTELTYEQNNASFKTPGTMVAQKVVKSSNKSLQFMQNPKIKLARSVSIISYSILFVIGATANLTVLYSLTLGRKSYKRQLSTYFQNHGWPRSFWLWCCYQHSTLEKASSYQIRDQSVIYGDSGLHGGSTKFRGGKQSLYSQASTRMRPLGLGGGRSFKTNSSVNQQYSSINSRIRLLILHLCIADLLVVFLMVPLEIAWSATVSWKAGDLACRILSFCRIFGIYLSSMVLVVISVDRCYTIYNPLKLHQQNRFVKILLSAAWAISILASLAQCFIFHVETHPEYKWFKQCVTFNSFPSAAHELAYNLFTAVMLYVIPLVVVITCYALILIKVRKKSYMSAAKKPKPSLRASFFREINDFRNKVELRAMPNKTSKSVTLMDMHDLKHVSNGQTQNQIVCDKHFSRNYVLKNSIKKLYPSNCQCKSVDLNSKLSLDFHKGNRLSSGAASKLTPTNDLILKNQRTKSPSSKQELDRGVSKVKEASSDVYPLNEVTSSLTRISDDSASDSDAVRHSGKILIEMKRPQIIQVDTSYKGCPKNETQSNKEFNKATSSNEDLLLHEKVGLVKLSSGINSYGNYLQVMPNNALHSDPLKAKRLSTSPDLLKKDGLYIRSKSNIKNGLSRGSTIQSKTHFYSIHSRSSTTTTTTDFNQRDLGRPSFLSTNSSMSKNSVPNLLRRTQTKRLEGARNKILKMTTIIIAAFLFCWTPYFVMSFWYYFSKETATKVDPIIQKILFIFAVFNSCFNPLVYGIFNAPTSSSLFKSVLKK